MPGGMSAFVAANESPRHAVWELANSRFYEPTGLDPRNVSTALELGKMVQAASHYAKIRELTTSNYGQAYTSNGKLQQYKNTNVLVREGLMNITLQKTGYIREAGRSMVLQAKMGQNACCDCGARVGNFRQPRQRCALFGQHRADYAVML